MSMSINIHAQPNANLNSNANTDKICLENHDPLRSHSQLPTKQNPVDDINTEMPITLDQFNSMKSTGFKSQFTVLAVHTRNQSVQSIQMLLRRWKPQINSSSSSFKSLLFEPRFRFPRTINDSKNKEFKYLLLNEDITSKEQIPPEVLKQLEEHTDAQCEIVPYSSEYGYDCLNYEQVLSEVFPPSINIPTSYITIGHIAHLNLLPAHYPYRHIIGQTILDKYPQIKTVATKTSSIESEFRVSPLELIAGEPNYNALVKEGNIRYELDYSAVYWNSRLSHEHERMSEWIIKDVRNSYLSCRMQSDDGFERKFDCNYLPVVVDAFCGIGPFVLPIAKQWISKQTSPDSSPIPIAILANDKNPISYHYLIKNIKHNLVGDSSYLHAFNMDARDFIRSIARSIIENTPMEVSFSHRQIGSTAVTNKQRFLPKSTELQQVSLPRMNHILMNLPASAVEFCDVFHGLFSYQWKSSMSVSRISPSNHFYNKKTGENYSACDNVIVKSDESNSCDVSSDLISLTAAKLKFLKENLPMIHVYCFIPTFTDSISKEEPYSSTMSSSIAAFNEIINKIETNIGCPLPLYHITSEHEEAILKLLQNCKTAEDNEAITTKSESTCKRTIKEFLTILNHQISSNFSNTDGNRDENAAFFEYVHLVRNVSPSKNMFCISFRLPEAAAFANQPCHNENEIRSVNDDSNTSSSSMDMNVEHPVEKRRKLY